MRTDPRPSEVRQLLAELGPSTKRLLEDFAKLDSNGLNEASQLAGWSRRMVGAHLAFVAAAYERITAEALKGSAQTTSYPGGAEEREKSLLGFDGLFADEARERLVQSCTSLHAAWRPLTDGQWSLVERDDRLGRVTLGRLAALRLTEIEVHHADLGMGYQVSDWPPVFVSLCLPLRIAWLGAHHRQRPAADLSIDAHWLINATDAGTSWVVETTGPQVTTRTATPDTPADASLTGRSADLLAFILGRKPPGRVELGGDPALAGAFKRAFPGP